MNLEKVWFNKVDKDHNFVVFHDNKIYKLKTKPDKLYQTKTKLDKGIIDNNFLALPINYIKKIEYRADDKLIRLFYGKNSEDEIRISDTKLREEIFLHLKSKTSHQKFEIEKPNLIKRIKKPLIALCIILAIFIYVLNVAHGLNSGYEYELTGGRPGIGSIVLILATLGIEVNVLIFSFLSFIAGFRIFKNLNDNSEIHRISYK